MECLSSSAYTSPLVFDMDPYVDVQLKDPSTDLLRRILYRVLPHRLQEKWNAQSLEMGISKDKLPKIPIGTSHSLTIFARFWVALFGGSGCRPQSSP